jgi:2-C-methyl-D-erythritol 4-phosphate cytidylyltransferase
MSVAAIVPAAGSSKRFGPGRKLFYPLRGRPVLLWALQALQDCPHIEEIIPVLQGQEAEEALRLIEEAGLRKIKRIAPGGRSRQESVRNGLRLLGAGTETVLVHDGARPLISPEFVSSLIEALGPGIDAVVPALEPVETIKEVNEEGMVRSTLPRHRLVAVQTPQVFRYRVLLQAHEQARGLHSTDDAALLEALGRKVKVLPGLRQNLKITTLEDIALAEALLG